MKIFRLKPFGLTHLGAFISLLLMAYNASASSDGHGHGSHAERQGAEHDEHGHGSEHDEHAEEKGLHGGRLFHEGEVTVELSIFEQGVLPEYRAWITRNDEAVTGDETELIVKLTRLGGQTDTFYFTEQEGYWLGNGVVSEPHSFDVEMELHLADKSHQWAWESHEGRTQIGHDIAKQAGIKSAVAGAGAIQEKLISYGRITVAPDQISMVKARFPGVVTRVVSHIGDRVHKGDVMAEIESSDSMQEYALHAPLSGTVTSRSANVGEVIDGQSLFTITNFETLWAELKIFPGQQSEVSSGQKVTLTIGDIVKQATISHLIPPLGNKPYMLARVPIANQEHRLSPGGLVTGEIVIREAEAPLLVDNRSLQSFRDWTVAFIQVGDTYEIRPLELGTSDGQFTEVLSGLKPGDRYVVENSYLIKADIEKSGASHDH